MKLARWLGVFLCVFFFSTQSYAGDISFSDSSTLTAGKDKFYEITLPVDHRGWRIAINSSGNCDLYLRKDTQTGPIISSKSNDDLHTLLVQESNSYLEPGSTYFIQVHANTSLNYSLLSEPQYAKTLNWDPGTAAAGTKVLTNPDSIGGDYLYEITSQTSKYGAWRSALTVLSGEADLAIQQNSAPTSTTSGYYSHNTGSDGYILDNNEFNTNQTWYILVRAQKGSTWNLFSGDLYVQNLGQLAEDSSSSSGTVTIGPEGTYYFSTSVGQNTKAWRLFTGSQDLPIYVNEATAPVNTSSSYYQQTENGQMLLVPPYLVNSLYLVGVSGVPGTTFSLDSRKQQIRTPSTQANYVGSDEFAFTLNGSDDKGYGYITYRIDVPIDQIAWQVNTSPTSGDPHVYLRKGEVPNRWNNDGLSEAVGSTTIDSIVQVPPTLTNGTWYVTVYGKGSFSYKLSSDNPVITPISFINDVTPVTNTATRQSGWRYFQTTTALGLGWELELMKHIPGSEIAIRRNAVPGKWFYRNNSTNESYRSEWDASSASALLQRPGHQADVWYVGVYLPDQALGAFDLYTRSIPSPNLVLNNGTTTITNQQSSTFKFFKVVVPNDPTLLGWDLRLTNVTSGMPRMVVRRDELPDSFYTSSDGGNTYIYHRDHWDSGGSWAPEGDYTARPLDPTGTINEMGRVLTMGIGSPLEPGTYYIGISNTSASAPMSYTLQSRGIGMGGGWAIQVKELDFKGGTLSKTGLSPRETAFYKVTVPANTPSWSLHMKPSQGEAMMAIRHGRLPNIAASSVDTTAKSSYYYTHFEGRKLQKDGQEFFYKYQPHNEDYIEPGDYYIAVSSEGQNLPAYSSGIGTGSVNFTITSEGIAAIDGGDNPPVLPAQGERAWNAQQLDFGEQKRYRFRVPAGTSSVELQLRNRVGNPVMSVLQDSQGANHIPMSGTSSTYQASENGWSPKASHPEVITIANPQGDFTVVVAADAISHVDKPDASFDLVVKDNSEVPLDLNSGSATVTNQQSSTFKFFKVVVPNDPTLLGWDLRLTNVTSGMPRIVVRRDELPDSFYTSSDGGNTYIYHRDHWDSGWSWAPESDYTSRPLDATGTINEVGRFLTMGIGSPLEPGTYYIGISNTSASAPMSYTLQSRGIGMGSNWAIQVKELDFKGGTLSKTGLLPRETAFYKVTVPANTPSWSLHMKPSQGEAMMAIRHGRLPNIAASSSVDTTAKSSYYYTHFEGRKLQKDGQEFFYKYQPYDKDYIEPGDYYIAVSSEGQNLPAYSSGIGTGSVNFTITSEGIAAIDGGDNPPVLPAQGERAWNAQQLDFGEQKRYRFRVPAGTSSVELQLRNRVGNPVMSVLQDSQGANHIPMSGTSSTYQASENGWSPKASHPEVITIANTQGDFTVVVAADAISHVDKPDASFDLVVRENSPKDSLSYTHSTVSGTLLDGQLDYYRVDVPETSGWRLFFQESNGNATLRLKKGSIPDETNTNTFSSSSDSDLTVVTPPFLTPGTWYVEVNGNGLTDYTLTSSPVEPLRQWSMPPVGGSYTQPGLTAPFFGDSGVLDNGQPVVNPNTGGQGIDIAEGDVHFYKLTIPKNNGGLLRTKLEALSGDTDIYIRKQHPPTLSHKEDGTSGYLYDRYDSRSNTLYGNWVVMNGKNAIEFDAGEWWIGIRAETTNCRYRLQLSTGDIQDMDLAGGTFTSQSLVAKDIRYYKLSMPQSSVNQSNSTPMSWTVNFTQQLGDVAVLVRDTLPPGQGSHAYYDPGTGSDGFQDWYDDNAYISPNPYLVYDNPGSHPITLPPIKPGHDYYLGVYAKSDAVFDISSTISSEKLQIDAILDYASGSLKLQLQPGEERVYRIYLPPEATRWQHSATHSGDVRLYLSQSTLPPKSDYADWRSGGSANSSFSTYLYQNNFPWQPDRFYYLIVENSGTSVQDFSLSLGGKQRDNDDYDEDGILDWWEWQYFNTLNYSPQDDYDGDGVNNLVEYNDGTDPTNAQDANRSVSLKVRILLQGAYDSSTGLMEDTLNAHGLLPTSQPYSAAPFNYTGQEKLSSLVQKTTGNDAIVDWMLVELRDAIDPKTILKTQAVMVQRDGDLVDAQTGSADLRFADTLAGNYYVSVRHRNHLGVMTATAIAVSNAASIVDFNLTATPTYGSHARLEVGAVALLWTGDANQTQQIIGQGQYNDINAVLGNVLVAKGNLDANSNYRLMGYYASDLNLDGMTLYTGPGNDVNLLLGNILLHPANTNFAANFIVNGTLPK